MNVIHYQPWSLHREFLKEFNKAFEGAAQDASSAATADSIPIFTAIDAISVYDLRAFFGGRADWFLRRVTRSATLGAAGCACSACSWRRRLPS